MGRLAEITDMWFLFAHGAGAPSTSTWMTRYSALLTQIAPVLAFDYDYMSAGKKRPDPHAKLLETHRQALIAGKKKHGPNAILVGKSMGGRIGCHLAIEESVLGVICLGYPLKGMGRAGKVRDQVLLDLELPALFVQGTRDTLCPLPLLREVLEKREARSDLYVVETGNHSLEPTKTFLKQSGKTAEDLEGETLERMRTFVGTLKSSG